MSNATMQLVYDAAKLFTQDTANLPALRDALKVHDADEAKAAPRKRTPKAAA